MMMNVLGSGLIYLAQLKPEALTGDPQPLLSESSSILTMLMGAILVIGILAISFRPSKRDRIEK